MRFSLVLGLSLLGPSLFAFAPTAHAGRTLFGKPVYEPPTPSAEEYARRKAAFEEGLATKGLVLDGDQIVPRPELRAEPDPSYVWEDPPHYATIFLNFFGGELMSGTNAAAMQAGCVHGAPVQYPGFNGTEAFALTVIQVFQNAMAPYAVRIAYEEAPPSHLPYSMVMMGGTPQDVGLGAGILGVSCSSDCGDQWWRDTTFAFTEESSSSLTLGNTALQEAAHAFGLDHIDGNDNIMYPYATSGDKVWAQACTPYNDATGGISCTYVHDEFCGEDAGQQNDNAELLAYFGPNEPDIVAPTVNIVEPEDGSEHPVGTNVSVTAEIEDDHDGAGWRLVVTPEGGDPVSEDAINFDKAWSLALPQGVYTIRVEAIDHDRNEAADEITVYVGEDAPATSGAADETGSADGSTGDGNEGADGTDESDDNGDDESDSGGPMQDDDSTDRGCTCAVPDASLPPLTATALLLLAGVRRRRRD